MWQSVWYSYQPLVRKVVGYKFSCVEVGSTLQVVHILLSLVEVESS